MLHLFFLFTSADVTYAEQFTGTGASLYAGCTSVGDESAPRTTLTFIKQATCMGFIAAMMGVQVKLLPAERYCIPDDVTVTQATLVFAKFLKDHPGRRDEPVTGLVIDAFRSKWPCPNS
jgi:hypothetical protein